MAPKSSSERMAESLARARRHWENQAKGESLPAAPLLRAGARFTIALSRQAGAHGTLLGRLLGAQLDWPVYDRDLLQRIAEEMGLRAALLESVDEKHQSWLQASVEAFASEPAVTESAFVRHLVESVLSIGLHGECVIVGRGAAQILPPETTLRVRLVAPLSTRIVTKSQELAMAPEEAARQVEKTDKERIRFIKDHFHKDPTDPSLYDLVLNTSRFAMTECVDLIIAALQRLQRQRAEK